MPRFLVTFNDGDMTFPESDLPQVSRDAHAVMHDALAAGVWVVGGGFDRFDPVVVASDGSVTQGPLAESESWIGGMTILDVATREDALMWAQRIADACRCSQEVREFMNDVEQIQAQDNIRRKRESHPVHHITLSVTNADESAKWYQQLLGPATVIERHGQGWRRVRMNWSSGLVIGVTEHEGTDVHERFDHRRVGLDHIGLTCDGESEVRDWKSKLEELGFEHGPLEDVAYGWAVTARDPDGIAVEFFAAK